MIKYFRAFIDDMPEWAAAEMIVKDDYIMIGKSCIARAGDWVVLFDDGTIRALKHGSHMAELLNPWQTIANVPQNVPLDVKTSGGTTIHNVSYLMGFWRGVEGTPTHWRKHRA